jgi:protein-disulfide isomerase
VGQPGDDLQTDVNPARDHWKGGEQPQVTMVMYGDFECPYTRLAYHGLQTFEDDIGDRLCFVFRHFPLIDKHPHAQIAAETAEAAALQDAYWPTHDLHFHRQKALEPPDLRRYAEELGLDLDRYDLALAEHLTLAGRIAVDVASGRRSGVHGTPTIFINARRYDGAREPEPLRAALEAAARS